MKKLLTILFCFIPILLWGQSTLLPGVQNETLIYNAQGWKSAPTAYVYLPWDYDKTTHKYPLICFFHGSGEVGPELTKMKEAGLPKAIADGHPPYSVNNEGDTTWFITLSIQTYSSNVYKTPTEQEMNDGISTLLDKYNLRIDTNRMYITGLSAGGRMGFYMIRDYPDRFPAAVLMSDPDAHPTTDLNKLDGNHIWFMSGDSDPRTSNQQTTYNRLNNIAPGTGRMTIYPGGHCCWDTYYNPTWREDSIDGRSLYDYFLQFGEADTSSEEPEEPELPQMVEGTQNISPIVYADSIGTVDKMYIYLPKGYDTATQNYPTIFFWTGNNGVGEGGSDLSKLLTQDLPYQINNNNPPYGIKGGDTIRFIVTYFQPTTTTGITLGNLSDWVGTLQRLNLKVDPDNIYFIGASQGAGDQLKRESGSKGWAPKKIIAASNWWSTDPNGLSGDIPIWFFQASDDDVVGTPATSFYNTTSSNNPGGGFKLTNFNGPHSGTARTSVFSPTWNDSTGSYVINTKPNADSISIYSWLLSDHVREVVPIVDAGPDQTLDVDITSTTLTGSATSDNGTITNYLWSTTSTATITSPTSASTTITGLENGKSYTFTLTATDEDSKTSSDDVTITVKSDAPFVQPVANAGPDRTISLPKDTVHIDGGLSTGSITSWEWSKIAGPSITILDPSDQVLVVSDLEKGTYKFNLTVHGDQGWNSSDQVYLTVLGTNSPPVADAGQNQTLAQGTTTVHLDGSNSTDESGIDSYLWTTETDATISTPHSAETDVTGLEDGNTYKFYLTVTDDSSATDMDSVYVSVGDAPPPPDTPNYQIPLDVNAKFWKGDTVFYQFNDLNRHGESATHLIDEQNSEAPTTVFEKNYEASVKFGKMYVVIDLGGLYSISSIKIFKYYGTADLYILTGSPTNWTDTLNTGHGGNSWRTYDTNIYTRYLKIYYGSGYQKAREMKLFGHLVKDSLTRTPPNIKIPSKTKFTMGQFMGFNQEGPLEVDSVGSMLRHYFHMDWADTVTTTHDIDSIKFVFSIFGHEEKPLEPLTSNWPVLFPDTTEIFPGHTIKGYEQRAMHQNGNVGYFDSFKEEEPPTYARNQGHGKPIDTVNHPYDPTNAHNYDRFSRMMWTYAAYLGSQTHPADSMQTPYPGQSGLDTRSYVEGLNEANADWLGRDFYYSPEEFTAISSAIYDGDVGTMGSRMGVKNADPDMTVVMGGTAGMHIDYLKGIHYFSYYKRKDHSIPFDIVNVHTYPTTGTNGENDETHAFSPERYFARGNFRDFIVECSKLMPGKPIWLTEWGYDRNGKSPISVPQFGGLDSAQVQAQWIARWWLMMSFTGIQRSTIFQLKNDPFPGTFGDSLGIYKFNTTGLTDGRYVGDVFTPGNPTSNYYAYPAYYFQRTIWLQLYNYKPDSIIISNQDSIYVYKYVNVNDPDSVAYAVWSGTMTNRSTSKYDIKIGHNNSVVKVITLADKHFTGIETDLTTNEDGNLPLTISETPKLIFTKESDKGGELVDDLNPPPTENNLQFKWMKKKGDKYYLLFFNPENGRYYNLKLTK